MAGEERPVVRLVLTNPQTLADVAKWARLAESLGFPSESTVAASHREVTVAAYLAQTRPAESSDGDQ